MKKAPAGSETSLDPIQDFKRRLAEFPVGTKWKLADLGKFYIFAKKAPSCYPHLNDAESQTLNTLFDEALRGYNRHSERYKQAEKKYSEYRKRSGASCRLTRESFFRGTIHPYNLWVLEQRRRPTLNFNRMTDQHEEVLREKLPASQSESIEDMDGLIKELRTCWDFLFAHGKAKYPVFCTHGKVTDSEARLNALANAVKKLDDYELGTLLHLLKANMSLSAGIVPLNDKNVLDFLIAFKTSVEHVSEILKKDAKLIRALSGQPDYTGVRVLKILYEKYCKHEAASTANGPFTKFALEILQTRITVEQGYDSQPFRRALEALEDPDFGKVVCQKYADLSFVSLPEARLFSDLRTPFFDRNLRRFSRQLNHSVI